MEILLNYGILMGLLMVFFYSGLIRIDGRLKKYRGDLVFNRNGLR